MNSSRANAPPMVRVLIVEDEPLLAESLRADLTDAGFEVVGVAPKIDKALMLIEEVAYDLAIIDANLGGVSAAPAAVALTSRKVPFIVLSGYARAQLSDEFAAAAFVQKPYRLGRLMEEVKALLARREAGA
jgi:DNA-binding response OmpR family regulator